MTSPPAPRPAARLGRLRASAAVPAKAYGIYRDYVRELYFPANSLSGGRRLRCAMPLLFIELLVYQVDAITEKSKSVDLDVVRNEDYETLHKYKEKFRSLLRLLRAYNETTARQMDYGELYVRLENKVTSSQTVDYADLIQLIELRSSDVRLMHGMIFALLGRPCDDKLMELLWPVEVLSDIANDLDHYAKDVAAGQFNAYAAFVALFGAEAPARVRAEIDRYEERYRGLLAAYPPGDQARLDALCARRYRSRTARIPEVLEPVGSTPNHPEGAQ
jgi:hypothetical protein